MENELESLMATTLFCVMHKQSSSTGAHMLTRTVITGVRVVFMGLFSYPMHAVQPTHQISHGPCASRELALKSAECRDR
jgi:hypothetical protein